jgi:hypothetical protein
MKERPILFSGPMVLALLEGRKTQTRRMVTKLPLDRYPCPYGGPGDRLWVRETWQSFGDSSAITPPVPHACQIRYAADGTTLWLPVPPGARGVFPGELGKFRPSIHMPRWAARIVLEVEEVREELLQDIGESDTVAEGLRGIIKDGATVKWGIPDKDGLPGTDDYGWEWARWERDPIQAYRSLWEQINGYGSWDANPLVRAVTFRVLSKEGA